MQRDNQSGDGSNMLPPLPPPDGDPQVIAVANADDGIYDDLPALISDYDSDSHSYSHNHNHNNNVPPPTPLVRDRRPSFRAPVHIDEDGDSSSEDDPFSQSYISEETARCPVCSSEEPVVNMLLHIMYNHAAFFAVWSSLNYPNDEMPRFDEYDITDTRENVVIPTLPAPLDIPRYHFVEYPYYVVEDTSYEFLSQICDSVGNHKVGVTDIDYSAPMCDDDDVWSFEGICTVCLEPLRTAPVLRKMRGCIHAYCAPCIEQWLTENKTCPVCKRFVLEELSPYSDGDSDSDINEDSNYDSDSNRSSDNRIRTDLIGSDYYSYIQHDSYSYRDGDMVEVRSENSRMDDVD